MTDKNKSKAYAATRLLELLSPETVERQAVSQYLERVNGGVPQAEPTDDPGAELVGLDECLVCISKVHPSPGKAGSIRSEIVERQQRKHTSATQAATGLTPKVPMAVKAPRSDA